MSQMIKILDPIAVDLTDSSMEELYGDYAGTYWTSKKWLSNNDIYHALTRAFQAGYQACIDDD